MAPLQTVSGFFDTIAEAQQAVQRLLAKGFTAETVELSTPTGLNSTAVGDGFRLPTEADCSSGRFYASLFGSRDEVLPRQNTARLAQSQSSTRITVLTQSSDEAKQVAHLLGRAGAGDIAMNALT